MKYVAKDGRIFERQVHSHFFGSDDSVFWKGQEKSVDLAGLPEYFIDGESVDEATFRKEITKAIGKKR
jgi:hypothetical protein